MLLAITAYSKGPAQYIQTKRPPDSIAPPSSPAHAAAAQRGPGVALVAVLVDTFLLFSSLNPATWSRLTPDVEICARAGLGVGLGGGVGVGGVGLGAGSWHGYLPSSCY